MWHKAEWIGHPMRLELTRVGLLVKLANHYTTKGALNTTCVTVNENQMKIPAERGQDFVWRVEQRKKKTYLKFDGSARGVVVIAVGNEHGDTSSNPGRDWLHFT